MKTFSRIWIGLGFLTIAFGIALVIIAASNGITYKNIPTYSKSESYGNIKSESNGDIKSLDFDIGYGKVTMEEGNDFHIEANNLSDKNFKSYVENGTWVIKSNNNHFNFFDIQLPAIGSWNFDKEPEIVITVPKGFEAEDISLSIGAGVLEADYIHAKEGNFSVGAGTMTVDDLKVSKKSDYKIGAGKMELQDMDANNITIDCNVGHVEIDGKIFGDNKISCDVGSVAMNLSDNTEEYFYQIDSSIGNVIINNNSYTNIHGKKIGNEESVNKLFLDCSVGNITIN